MNCITANMTKLVNHLSYCAEIMVRSLTTASTKLLDYWESIQNTDVFMWPAVRLPFLYNFGASKLPKLDSLYFCFLN